MNIDDVVKRYLPSAPEERIQSGTDRVLQELRTRPYRVLESSVEPSPSVQWKRFAWAAGLAMAAVLVSVVVWREGPPSSVKDLFNTDDRTLSRLSSQQAGEILPVTVPPNAFDVVSVKLVDPSSEAYRAAKEGDDFQSALTRCTAGNIGGAQVDPGRFRIVASVSTLVIGAYGQDCDLVEGGPGWARSDEYYEISAVFPAGTPRYTVEDFYYGRAPVLQRMLQNLLANRFKLVLKREFREMPVYALTVAKPGKMKLSPRETIPPPASFPQMPGMPPMPLQRGALINFVQLTGEVQVAGHAISMSDLAKNLRQHAARRVVDKTGLNNLFDVEMKFVSEKPATPIPGFRPPPPPKNGLVPPLPVASLRTAIEELGLKLEPTRLPVEVLIIESVERPSEN
jgi:uncharacterized protein (TIGR03435 family)